MGSAKSKEEIFALAKQVFEIMRTGKSALKSCAQIGLSQSNFNEWLNRYPELVVDYTRAREIMHEVIADEIIAISDAPVGSIDSGATDSGAVQKQRLQVESRKWLLSKLAPKKWGDKLELSGDEKSPLQVKQTIDASKLPTEVLAQIIAAKNGTDRS